MRRLICCAFFCVVVGAAADARPQSVGAEARAAFARGMTAISAGKVDVAREAFARAAALAPEWGLVFLEWGVVEASIDPTGALALECLKKAAALAPGNPRVHYQLGLLYQQQEKREDAIRELRAALALRTTMRDARYLLAQVLAENGANDEAVATLLEVIREEPSHTGALIAVAELHEKAGKFEEAEQALISLTRAQPKVAYNHYRLGQFYERTGDAKKAKQAFAHAEALDPRPKRSMRKLR